MHFHRKKCEEEDGGEEAAELNEERFLEG